MQVSSPGPAGKLLSPYQKPVRLFLQLIRNHSLEGSWFLDATGGSGRNLCSLPLFQHVASSYNIIETCDIMFLLFYFVTCPGTTLVACAVGGYNCVCVDKDDICVEGMLYRMLCLNSLPGLLGECNEILVEQPAGVVMEQPADVEGS